MGLNNSQFQTILRKYEEKQLANRALIAKRYQEVCDKLPKYPDFEDAIVTLSVEFGKKVLDGDEGALATFRKELAKLKQAKEDYLLSGGFPLDYLESVYTCPDCKDTGFVDDRKCHCFKCATILLLYEQSNLKDILLKQNFDTFSFDFYSKDDIYENTGLSIRDINEDVVAKCKNYINNFTTEFQNIYLYGNTGVGKTFLLNCIAKDIINKEHSVLYFSAPELFDILIKGAFDRYDSDSNNVRDLIYDCDLLIIDDLGTEYINNAVISQLFICLNDRLQHKKPVVISSNLSPNKLADTYSERIGSRIVGNYLSLRLVGKDIRVHKN